MSINEQVYNVKRLKSVSPSARTWQLTKPDRVTAYVVVAARGTVSCTCPDHAHRGAQCKHIRALKAVGLVGKRARTPLFVALARGTAKGGV